MPGSFVGMDGEEETGGNMPGAVDTMDGAFALAETGDGGDASGAGAQSEPGQGTGAITSASGNAGEEAVDTPNEHSTGQAGKDVVKSTGSKESADICVKGREACRPCPAQE